MVSFNQRKQSRRALVLGAAAAATTLAGMSSVHAALTHRYSFSEAGGTTVTDSIGGADGTFVIKTAGANAVIANGRLSLGNSGTSNVVTAGNYVDLPNNIAKTSDLTIEGWVTYNGGGNDWQRIFDFGNTTSGEQSPTSTTTGYQGLDYLFVTPKAGGGNYRGELNLGPANARVGQLVDRAPAATFPAGGDQHFALTKTGSVMTLYLNGQQVGQNTNATNDNALTDQVNVWLGRSNWQGDAFFNGAYNEFRIYDEARTAAQIGASFGYGPDNLGPAGVNIWQTAGSGNFSDIGGWSQNRVPSPTDQAVINNGATVTVNSDVGTNAATTLNNGTLTFTGGGAALNTILDLAPSEGGGTAILNLNGGTLTVPRILIDTGVVGGAGTKAINFDGGTLSVTDTFTLAGGNLTTTVGAAGGTIGVAGGKTVTWAPVLTPAGAATLLTKTGAGALVLDGGYAGSLVVRGGTLSAPANAVGLAGTTIQLGGVAVAGQTNTAELVLTGNTPGNVDAPITAGVAGQPGTSTVRVAGNTTVTFAGPVTLNQNLTVANAATTGGNGTTFTGGFTSGSADAKTLTFDNAGTVNVTAAGISDAAAGGPISVVKNNTGVVFLETANTYAGTTTINGGGVVFAAPDSIGGTGKSVTVNANGVAVAGTGFDPNAINTTFFNRIANDSSGVLALSADSAENFDFSPAGQNLPAAFLGAAAPVTLTGTITPGGGAYRLGGGGGALTIANAGNNALSGNNALIVGGQGGGSVTINGTNNFTGPTSIRGGTTLIVPSTAALGTTPLADPLAIHGTLRITGGPAITLPATVTVNGPSTFDFTPDATLAGNLTVTPPANPANGASLTKTGPGTLTITGNVQLGNNSFFMKQGTVDMAGSAVVNTTFFSPIGQSGADNATLIVRDNAQYTVAHDFNVGDVDTARGVLYIRDNAQVKAVTFYAGKFNSTQGAVVQTGGTLTDVNTGGGEWRIGGTDAGAATAVGTYDLSAGSLTTARNLQVGAFGSGSLYVTGGSASGGGYSAVGRFTGGYGVLTVTGTGTFTHTGPANNLMIVGEQGVGIINVSNGGRLNDVNAPLHLALAQVGSGFVNLGAGGTIAVPRVTAGPGVTAFNFHGGTLTPTVSGPDGENFIVPNAYVWSEGGTIDTDGKNVTLTQALAAPFGDGVASIPVTSGGSGYVAHPVVRISGGGGSGASAIPVVTNGVVTGIQITNPGVGYTGAVTVEILGGGGSGATAGESVLAPNTSGGFTKAGEGTLTLSAQNDYRGDTTVTGGTLKLNAAGAVPSGADRGIVVVNGGETAAGTIDLNGSDTTFNALAGAAGATAGRVVNSSANPVTLTLGGTVPTATFGGQIADTPGAGVLGLTKVGAGTQTLGGASTYTGVTQVAEGVLRVTGSVAGSESVNTTGGTFEAAGSQTVRQLFLSTGKATVTGPAAGTTRTVLTVGNGTNDAPLIIAETSILDVTTQAMVYDHSAATTTAAAVSEVRGHILAGYGPGKNWNGTTGITSSSAAADTAKAVGYASAAEVLGAGGGPFLGNAGVDESSVLVRFTLAGDATLDGAVNFNDLVRLAQNYNTTVSATTQSWWFNGDFTYDGLVNFNDLVKLAQNYNTALPAGAIPGAPAEFGADLAAAFAAVPEPSTALLALAACGLAGLGRRRRVTRG